MKLVLYLTALSSFACQSPKIDTKQSPTPTAFVSILPVQYFVDQISGGKVSTEVMVRPGFSPATYEPLASQMANLSNAQLFFMVGHLGFEEAWKSKLEATNPAMKLVDLSRGISMLAGGHVHHDGESVDPHIWLSPDEVRILINNITETLIDFDSTHQNLYISNAQKLLIRVDSLDDSMDRRLSSKLGKNIYIFHPVLGYLARNYGMHQVSIEHEGKEPTPKKIEALVQGLKLEDRPVILVQREFDKKHAEVLAREANAQIVEIHPLAYDWFAMMDELVKAIE